MLAAGLSTLGGCTGAGEAQPKSQEKVIKFSRQGYEVPLVNGYLHDVAIVISEKEWNGLLRDMQAYAGRDPVRRP